MATGGTAAAGTSTTSKRRSAGARAPYLQKQGRVQGEYFVASVEFGNELMGGAGTTWVDDYQVFVTAASAASPK